MQRESISDEASAGIMNTPFDGIHVASTIWMIKPVLI
jgi:hypothetical protein